MRQAIALLLLLYPSEFRRGYGRLIELQARDELTSRRGPLTAPRIVADLILGAVAERVAAYVAAPINWIKPPPPVPCACWQAIWPPAERLLKLSSACTRDHELTGLRPCY